MARLKPRQKKKLKKEERKMIIRKEVIAIEIFLQELLELKEEIFGKEFGAINKINAQEFYITIPSNIRLAEEEENRKKSIRQK